MMMMLSFFPVTCGSWKNVFNHSVKRGKFIFREPSDLLFLWGDAILCNGSSKEIDSSCSKVTFCHGTF